MNRTKRIGYIIVIILVLSSFFQTIPFTDNHQSCISAEPNIKDNGDYTMTATWNFENENDYLLYNTTMSNGEVNLTLNRYWWNQTTQEDFNQGTFVNTSAGTTGEVNLTYEMKTINLLKTGDFSSSQNWTYISGDNIISTHNDTGENAELGYTYSTSRIAYLVPADGKDDGTVTYWVPMALFSFDFTSDFVEIGYRNIAGDDWRRRAFFYFNLSSIPSSAVIEGVKFYAKIQQDSPSSNHRIDIHALDVARENTNATGLYIDCDNGTCYINNDDSLKNGVPRIYHEWNLTNLAVIDVQSNLSRGWFGIGIHEEGDDDYRAVLSSVESDYDPQLNVSYTSSAPVTFNETAYVNQTFFKPNITPNSTGAANLSFDYSVEKFLNTSAELTVKIDNFPVWNRTINATTSQNTVTIDVSEYLTESRNYNISLQLNMNVNSTTGVDCVVKYDNIKITTIGFSVQGNYTSQVFDAGSEVIWEEISWNVFSPSETTFKIRTSTSLNNITWDKWSSDYMIASGEQITSQKGRYIKFTCNLSTTNYTKTPVLFDVSISYMKYSWNGKIEMKEDLLVENIGNWGTFKWEDQTNVTNGQNITYWYSINQGFDWVQVPQNGNMSSISIFSGSIRFRANFTTSNPTGTPTLFKWNLTYEVSELPSLSGGVEPGTGNIKTWFNFTLRYSDKENEPPSNLTLNITGGTSHLGSWNILPNEVDPSDTNYTDGKFYYLNITNFTRGSNYTYHFAAQDSRDFWSISGTKDGPFVLNNPPRIMTNNILGAQEGELYYVDYDAEDLEDEDNLIWLLSSNASWLGIDSDNGILSGTPTSSDKGTCWVNLTVKDGYGGFDWTNFTIVVGDTIPPIADAGEDDWVFEDEIYQFNGTNSFDNSGILNFTWYLGDGSMDYGPQPEHIYTKKGIYPITLIVRDLLNNEDMDLINITVVNKPPIADAGVDTTVYEGEPVFFNGSKSYDTPSDNNTLIYLWFFDNDDIYDGVGKTTSYIWYDDTIITVRLKVIDDDSDFNISEITVRVFNVDPIVEIGDYYTGAKGSEIIIIASSFDPGLDELEFRWDWENDGKYDTNWSKDFVARHIWGSVGNYTVRVEVRDGDGGFGTDTTKVNITKRKVPPVIQNLGSRQVRYNTPFTIDLTPYISDEDTPLSELMITTSDPAHISVVGLKITLIYPESMIGQTVSVEIFVSDGIFMDSEFLTVLITVNYPPTLKIPIPDVQFNEDDVLGGAFNLNDHFEDIDLDKLTFEAIYREPNLFVTIHSDGRVDLRALPNWAGNTSVKFLAEDPSGALDEDEIFVSVVPINDPPIILKQIRFTNIGENENWSIDLSEYFLDVDSPYLIYTCNYPEIEIDQLNHTARWVPGNKKELKDVVITASDGEHSVSITPFDLKVFGQEAFPWFYIILALILGALVFAAYREVRYRYSIEEVFLVDNAGVLLVHLSRGESKAIDAKLVSGMLTAVQEFVRDSFMGNDEGVDLKLGEGALGKLEYGDFQIVIERGEHTFLSAVISGYDNRRLRKRMRDVVEKFEGKYKDVLVDWDGDMAKFEGAERIVGRLIKGYSIAKEVTRKEVDEKETSEIEDIEYENEDELPYGDFGDVPSYYDDINNEDMGKFDAPKDYNERQQKGDNRESKSSGNQNNKSTG